MVAIIICKTCNEIIGYDENEKVSVLYSYCKKCIKGVTES